MNKTIHVIISSWIQRQPSKVKAFFAVVFGMVALVLLPAIVHNHSNLFIAAEVVHAIGITLLVFKLSKQKTCAGQLFNNMSINELYNFLASLFFYGSTSLKDVDLV